MWFVILLLLFIFGGGMFAMGNAMERDCSDARIRYAKSIAETRVEDIVLARYKKGEIVTTYPRFKEGNEDMVYVEFKDGRAGYMNINNLNWLKYVEELS